MLRRRSTTTRALLSAATLLVGLACRSARLDPPHDVRQSGVGWRESEAVEPLMLLGVVFDLETGAPLNAAQISVPSQNIGALSDSRGRFRLALTLPGPLDIHVSRIDYGPRAVHVAMPKEHGVVIQVGLPPADLHQCGEYRPDAVLPTGPQVRLRIRDARTGQAPSVPVVVRARSPISADSALVAPVAADSLSVILALSSAQPLAPWLLDVSVTSSGHAAWTASDVPLEQACPFPMTPLLNVWLLPN